MHFSLSVLSHSLQLESLILQHLPETDLAYPAKQVVQVLPGEQISHLTSEQQYNPSELRTFGSFAVVVHPEHLVAFSATVQSRHGGSVLRQQAVLATFGIQLNIANNCCSHYI